MDFALVLRELISRWRLLIAGAAIAAVIATLSVYRLEGFHLKSKSLQHSSATTQVLIDTPGSVLGNLSQSFEPLSTRALVYSNFMTSPVVLHLIGQQAGIPGEQIYAAGPVNANVPRVEQEPTALRRNVQISGETKPFRLNFNSDASLPTITIVSQAPTTTQAVNLANGAARGLQLYVASLQSANKTPQSSRVTIRQLGSANGAVVDGGISRSLAAIVFLVVFAVWCAAVLLASRFREIWRASGAVRRGWQDPEPAQQGWQDPEPASKPAQEGWHPEPASKPRKQAGRAAIDVEEPVQQPEYGAAMSLLEPSAIRRGGSR
jgi:hypothetical protein